MAAPIIAPSHFALAKHLPPPLALPKEQQDVAQGEQGWFERCLGLGGGAAGEPAEEEEEEPMTEGEEKDEM